MCPHCLTAEPTSFMNTCEDCGEIFCPSCADDVLSVEGEHEICKWCAKKELERLKVEKTPLKELPLLLGSLEYERSKRTLEQRITGNKIQGVTPTPLPKE